MPDLARLAGRTVLVIDVDEAAQDAVRTTLEPLGLRVLVAADGDAGLRVLEATRPDLVLCDLQMPQFDGFGFMARVRESPGLGGMPIVAVSRRASLADIARCRALGFRAHVVKPLTPEVLAMLLKALL